MQQKTYPIAIQTNNIDMNSEILLKKSEELWTNLSEQLNTITKDDNIASHQKALMVCDEAIRQLKSWVKNHQFDTWEREMRFFKKIKPKFVAKFILYSRIISIESSLPSAGLKFAKKEYENEFLLLNQFAKENSEFISYFRKNSTYLDSKYFLRYKYDLHTKLAMDLHSYDESFSTSHDNLVAQIIANEEYERYLKGKIKKLQKDVPDNSDSEKHITRWTGSKAEISELILALHVSGCFNNGNIDASTIVREIEKNWNIDLGNYYKTVSDIKSRKINRVKFLQKLTDNLYTYFENADE